MHLINPRPKRVNDIYIYIILYAIVLHVFELMALLSLVLIVLWHRIKAKNDNRVILPQVLYIYEIDNY